MGVPLDDSWIHQTLARSLAQTGTLAVNPGQPVAASTSPMWSAVLTGGYALGVPSAVWTWGAGALSFEGVILGTHALGRVLFPQRTAVSVAAAVFTALDWHMAWSAASGMETALFVALALALLRLGAVPGVPLPLLGVAGRLATLARPEGSVLFVGALIGRLLMARDRKTWLTGSASALALFGIMLLPVVLYHLSVFGNPLPATFFRQERVLPRAADRQSAGAVQP